MCHFSTFQIIQIFREDRFPIHQRVSAAHNILEIVRHGIDKIYHLYLWCSVGAMCALCMHITNKQEQYNREEEKSSYGTHDDNGKLETLPKQLELNGNSRKWCGVEIQFRMMN